MKSITAKPTLMNYIFRLKMDRKLLKKNPQNEMLQKRIKQDEKDIINYVTTDTFEKQAEHLNL